MNAIYSLDRAAAILSDAAGRVFDPRSRQWSAGVGGGSGESVDARGAVAWLQRESGAPIRVPVGVIGPREADPAQLAAAEGVGARARGDGPRHRLRRAAGRDGSDLPRRRAQRAGSPSDSCPTPTRRSPTLSSASCWRPASARRAMR